MAVRRAHPRGPEQKLWLPGPLVIYHGAIFEGSAQRLRAAGMVTEVRPQSREALSPAAQTLKTMLAEGSLRHDGSPGLAAAIGNLVGTPSPRGWFPEALDPRVPITAAIAGMVALERAQLMPQLVARPAAAAAVGF